MRFCKLLLPLLASTLVFASQPDRITQPISASQTVTLTGHVAPQALPEYDQGLVEPSFQLTVTMLLAPSPAQDRALTQLLAEQQDRHSRNFHKWLTPEQYADRFGLGQSDMGKISAWLTSQGVKVIYVARGRDFITFQGDAAHVQNLLNTEIRRYTVSGKQHFANSTPPSIPAALEGIVSGFRGLHNFFPHSYLKPAPSYSDVHFATHFLAPGDVAAIYDINPLYQMSTAIDGTGQKIVIVGQTDIYLADINDFRNGFSLTPIPTGSGGCSTNGSGVIISPCSTTNFKFVISGTGGDPGVSAGDLGESDLDIEWSGSVARNAQIIFVTSSGGVNDSASWAIDNQLASVMSMSYGLCEALVTAPGIAAQDAVYKKAAGLGISFFASSGDAGAATCDGSTGNDPATLGVSVSYPASSVYVTAVGGTEFNEGSGSFWNASNGANGFSAKGYIPELAWNDSNLEGQLSSGGGGPSNCAFGSGTTSTLIHGQSFAIEVCNAPTAGGFPKPSFQVGITPNDSVRDVPDISFSASNANDPYIVCLPQSELGFGGSTSTCVAPGGITGALDNFAFPSAFGGTSVSSPVMAGMTALLNQLVGSAGPVGNVNTELYALYQSNPSDFHDVTTGFNSNTLNNSDNIVPCAGQTPSFEPSQLKCSAASGITGTLGFPAGTGYDLATGLGSFDVNALFADWAAAVGGTFTISASPATVTATAGQNAPTTITVTPSGGFAGTVAFSCTGLPAGATCSFNPTSSTTTTTLTVQTALNMAAGTNPFTVQGTSGNLSTTTSVTLTVTASTAAFTMATNPSGVTLSVAPGAISNNSVNLILTDPGNTGFLVTNGGTTTTALPLTYTCTITPPASEAGCSVSPSSPTSVTNPTVFVSTTAPTVQLRPPFGRGSRIFYAMLLPGLFGIVFAAGSGKRGARLLSLIVVLGLSTLWMGACGGGSSGGGGSKNPGTPAGNYTVNVTASTGGGNPIMSTTSFALTVQ